MGSAKAAAKQDEVVAKMLKIQEINNLKKSQM